MNLRGKSSSRQIYLLGFAHALISSLISAVFGGLKRKIRIAQIVYGSRNTYINATSQITEINGGRISISDDVYIGHGNIIIADAGTSDCGSPQADRAQSTVLIAHGVAINEYNNIRANGCKIIINEGSRLSQFVSLIGSDYELPASPERFKRWNLKGDIVIGRYVLLGAGSTVLPGISIGDYAVVGAGAVVTRDVEAGSTVVGNPARVTRTSDRVS